MEENSSMKAGKSRPMPKGMDGEHSKEKLEEIPEYVSPKRAAKEETATPPTPVEDKPVETHPSVQPAEATIEVPTSEWEEMKKNIADMKKKEVFFEETTDKRLAAQYYKRNKDKLPIHAKLSTWNTEDGPQVVIAWRMLVDKGEFRDPQTGRRIEKQDIEITLETDETLSMPYMIWVEQYSHIKCEQVGTETDEFGNEKWKLKILENGDKFGKIYTVGTQFIN